jgi:hypothetical protein
MSAVTIIEQHAQFGMAVCPSVSHTVDWCAAVQLSVGVMCRVCVCVSVECICA